MGLPSGGMDAQVPQGLPINLATAMQLAGVRPLDIAAATKQVEQALALQLQAKVLWVPNLNAGVDYFRHDGVQQNIFTGPNFQKGRNNLFVGGGPSLSVGLTDAIFAPLAARRVVDSRQADLQAARNDSLFAVAQAFFDLQQARGRLLGVGASIARAELLVNFATGLAPSLIAPLEINRARTELQSLLPDPAGRHPRLAGRQRPARGGPLLDPATLLEPIEPPFLQVTFFPAEQSAEELMPIALQATAPRSPRGASSSRRRSSSSARRRSRPLLPNLIIASPATAHGLLAAGQLSAGANGSLNTQRLPARYRGRRGLAVAERRARQRRPDPPAPGRAGDVARSS